MVMAFKGIDGRFAGTWFLCCRIAGNFCLKIGRRFCFAGIRRISAFAISIRFWWPIMVERGSASARYRKRSCWTRTIAGWIVVFRPSTAGADPVQQFTFSAPGLISWAYLLGLSAGVANHRLGRYALFDFWRTLHPSEIAFPGRSRPSTLAIKDGKNWQEMNS